MDIKKYQFEDSNVRVFEQDGELSFVAKDVVEAIGAVWNGTKASLNVPTEWKWVNSVLTPSGMRRMACLSEQGLCFFLNRSGKILSIPFQVWLSGELLPKFGKKGGCNAR